jgi:hypothetical protein
MKNQVSFNSSRRLLVIGMGNLSLKIKFLREGKLGDLREVPSFLRIVKIR